MKRYEIVYSWRSFAQAHWHWLPRVERFDWPRAGVSVRWLCGLWYAFESTAAPASAV